MIEVPMTEGLPSKMEPSERHKELVYEADMVRYLKSVPSRLLDHLIQLAQERQVREIEIMSGLRPPTEL